MFVDYVCGYPQPGAGAKYCGVEKAIKFVFVPGALVGAMR